MITAIQTGLATVILAEIYVIHQNLTETRARETAGRLQWISGIVSRSMQTGKPRKSLGKMGGFANISRTIKKANANAIPKKKQRTSKKNKK